MAETTLFDRVIADAARKRDAKRSAPVTARGAKRTATRYAPMSASGT